MTNLVLFLLGLFSFILGLMFLGLMRKVRSIEHTLRRHYHNTYLNGSKFSISKAKWEAEDDGM